MDKNNGKCNLYKLFILLNFRIVKKITIKLYELLRRKQKKCEFDNTKSSKRYWWKMGKYVWSVNIKYERYYWKSNKRSSNISAWSKRRSQYSWRVLLGCIWWCSQTYFIMGWRFDELRAVFSQNQRLKSKRFYFITL